MFAVVFLQILLLWGPFESTSTMVPHRLSQWGTESRENPESCKSRTGFVLMLGNTPLTWASRLQTEIALSTMEAEYIALSTAMRSLIPMRRINQTILNTYGRQTDRKSNISVVYEDNQATLTLATTDPPRLTPRSKHIAIKYHWFRSHIIAGEVEMVYLQTDQQRADILTKPLTEIKFKVGRKMIMGW